MTTPDSALKAIVPTMAMCLMWLGPPSLESRACEPTGPIAVHTRTAATPLKPSDYASVGSKVSAMSNLSFSVYYVPQVVH